MIQSQLIPNAHFNEALNSENSDEIDSLDMCFMEQSHSDIFIEVDKPGKYKADALITRNKRLALVVLTQSIKSCARSLRPIFVKNAQISSSGISSLALRSVCDN